MIWNLESWEHPCYNVNNGRCVSLFKWRNSKHLIYEETTNNKEQEYSLIKIFNYIKGKILKKQKKISSHDIDNLREQNSDNESDKTFYEKKCPSNSSRKANSVISNKSDKSTNTETMSNKSNDSGQMTKYTSKSLYRKRIKSIDYVRDNNNDDYNVVLAYQKYVPQKTFSSGTLFDANRIKNNS